jgi:hypothetical protein
VARVRQRHHAVELDAPGPRAHHHHAAAHEHRLVDVVGDEEHGLALRFPDAQQQFLHQLARLVVERAEGLVHQQHARVVGQRTGQRGALLHAARQLLGVVVLEAPQAHLADEGRAPISSCCARGRPRSRRPKHTLSSTVSQGNSV